MALPLFRTQPLIAPVPPNLPLAPAQYNQQYQEQFNNVLRLYFNQLKNFEQLFSTNTGGSLLQFPNGAFHQDGYTTLTSSMTNTSTAPIQVTSTAGFPSSGALLIENELISYTTKTATTFDGTVTRGVYGSTNTSHTAGVYVSEVLGVASASTALAIRMTTTDTSNQVRLSPTYDTRVYFDVAGYYNIQFSTQMLNFTTSIDNVTFWYRQNGADVAYSAGIVSIPSKHGSSAGAAIVSWNIVLPIAAGDYIELLYSSETGDTVTATYPPGTSPTRPASPAVILTATFVSALYT